MIDIPIDLSDITIFSDTNGTSPDVYNNFTEKPVEVTIIVLSFVAILINIAIFFSLKMFKVISSAILITMMTLILAMRIVTEGFKMADDKSNIVSDYILHIRVTHDISTYLFGLVLLVLFF